MRRQHHEHHILLACATRGRRLGGAIPISMNEQSEIYYAHIYYEHLSHPGVTQPQPQTQFDIQSTCWVATRNATPCLWLPKNM